MTGRGNTMNTEQNTSFLYEEKEEDSPEQKDSEPHAKKGDVDDLIFLDQDCKHQSER